MDERLVQDKAQLEDVCDYINIKKQGAEMREAILKIKEVMRDNNFLALSAPQIGIPLRIFCVKDKEGLHSFINPMIKKSVELAFSREKDEGFPDIEYLHPRSSKIVVNYQTPLGDMKATTVVGYSAFMVQRMIDHLNGVNIWDIGLELDDQWDKATEDERAEVLQAYMQSLDLMSKKLDDEIAADEDLTKQKKAIEFEHALVSGQVKVEQTKVSAEDSKKIEEKIEDVKATLTEKEA